MIFLHIFLFLLDDSDYFSGIMFLNMFIFNWLFKIIIYWARLDFVNASSEVLGGKEGISFEEILPRVDQDGWVLLQTPVTKPMDADIEEDLAVWVVFSKQLEKETFRLRFPVAPEYSCGSSGEEMIVHAALDGNEFSLQVLNPVSFEELMQKVEGLLVSSNISLAEGFQREGGAYDVHYQEGNVFVKQRFYSSLHHLYILQTKTVLADTELHEYFVDSFEIS